MMLGDRIRELREEKQLSQIEMAKLLNVANTTVSQWETGKRQPDIDTLEQLANLLNCTTDYLLGRTDYKTAYSVPLADFAEYLPADLKRFVLDNKGHQWAEVAAKADEYNLTPQDIKDLIDMVTRMKRAVDEKSK